MQRGNLCKLDCKVIHHRHMTLLDFIQAAHHIRSVLYDNLWNIHGS